MNKSELSLWDLVRHRNVNVLIQKKKKNIKSQNGGHQGLTEA
jgi:hypothetical protein